MSEGIQNFSEFKLNRQLLNAVEEQGYQNPTPIQARAIPLAMAGHDLIGIAQTGTGKTAAYLLPLLMKLRYAQDPEPRALILAPTRELAMQIEENARALSAYTDLRMVALYGGKGPKLQIEALEAGVDLVIATPGRLLDLYRAGHVVTKKLKTLILDEADKMMDMGFMHQIRSILEVIPRKRQNLLFSATYAPSVERLSEEFLEFPERVEVAPQATAAETVDQLVYPVPNLKTKINLLHFLLLDNDAFTRVIVFVRTRTSANDVAKFLERKVSGTVRVIHANKDQNARINAMGAFKEGDVRVLVTTDVSSRGIDVPEVSHVINFDVPLIYEDYVHRIGRTGRALKVGQAITFANPAEMLHLKKIEEIIRMEIPREEIPIGVEVPDTAKAERIEIERDIDTFKRKENPDFKGAFHEKKVHPHQRPQSGRGNARGGASRGGGRPKGGNTRGGGRSKGSKGGRRK